MQSKFEIGDIVRCKCCDLVPGVVTLIKAPFVHVSVGKGKSEEHIINWNVILIKSKKHLDFESKLNAMVNEDEKL